MSPLGSKGEFVSQVVLADAIVATDPRRRSGKGSRHRDLALTDTLRNSGDPCMIDSAGRVIEDDIDRRADLDGLEAILKTSQ
jgi:hypothetical protein